VDCNSDAVQFLVSFPFCWIRYRPVTMISIVVDYDSVNAHVEDLRSKFVAHEGKKTLHVEVQSFSFEEIATTMALAIHGNVIWYYSIIF
jgi:hypothetical protein